jgi:hypothetical protein
MTAYTDASKGYSQFTSQQKLNIPPLNLKRERSLEVFGNRFQGD